MWTDLMLDRVVNDQSIVEGIARVLGVRSGDIALVDEIGEQFGVMSQNPPIIIERAQLAGSFPLQLSISLRRSDLEQRICDPADEQAVIARLCAGWECSALFSDDALNPYSWFLMTPTGRLEEVTVDAGRLDDQDAFVITRVNRIVRQVPVVA
ncbi:MAG: hypothetical protein AB7R89_22920 [Dehalococcoidia bacterium]